MKNKTTAGIFAFFFGPLGLHRFYLGQRTLGRLYLVATALLFMFSIKVDGPVVMVMGIVSFFDAALLFSMGREEFDEKYNQRYLKQEVRLAPNGKTQRRQPAPAAGPVGNPAKASGIEKFKDYDYQAAIEDFKKALAYQFNDPAVHFNLACCYSLTERPDPAFFHLTKAVHFGFVDFDKIEKHDGLAFLRTQPEFAEFVKTGYQRHAATPANDGPVDLLAQNPAPAKPSLLDQIKRLSELREQGILTEAEFNGMRAETLKGMKQG
ncbi:MAG: NINE protein [Bacteroidetes bacterium]|nr:NINE protein [Bacteroidota bacterium]